MPKPDNWGKPKMGETNLKKILNDTKPRFQGVLYRAELEREGHSSLHGTTMEGRTPAATASVP